MNQDKTINNSNIDVFTKGEYSYILDLRTHLKKIQEFIQSCNFTGCSIDELFISLNNFCAISGNLNNPKSFGACLQAKKYLSNKYDIKFFDVSNKAQGAKGLDIDVMTSNDLRIIAEVKTTSPYNKTALGANQFDSFKKDLTKLLKEEAHKKYFFVTSEEAYECAVKIFMNYNCITVILLKYD